MNILSSITLGLIEGITEFLPVSSTFHLIQTAKVLGIPDSDFLKLFEVAIQSGAILSVVLLYFSSMKKNPALVKKVLVSFLPTAVIGFILYKAIKEIFFESQFLMLAVFAGMGVIFIIVEKLVVNGHSERSKAESRNLPGIGRSLHASRLKSGLGRDDFLINPHKPLTSLSYKDAFIIGLLQSLAVVPGVSRAGIVIVGALILGYKRDESAYYSFLLAIPTIFAAGAYDLYKSREALLASGENILLLATGAATACIFAYFTMKWLIEFLKKNSLVWFGVYRIILGVLLFFL